MNRHVRMHREPGGRSPLPSSSVRGAACGVMREGAGIVAASTTMGPRQAREVNSVSPRERGSTNSGYPVRSPRSRRTLALWQDTGRYPNRVNAERERAQKPVPFQLGAGGLRIGWRTLGADSSVLYTQPCPPSSPQKTCARLW